MVGGRRAYRGLRPLYVLEPGAQLLAASGGTDPFLGTPGEVCQAEELKIEVCCQGERLCETLAAIRAAHPYEEPVINVIPLAATGLEE